MKLRIAFTPLTIVLTAAFGTAAVRAEEKPAPKPYPLTTCVVSGEKLDGVTDGARKTNQVSEFPAKEMGGR